MHSWPYPFWIAHRGGGTLAPENTLAGFARGYRAGWRMFECDVQLSADGVPFLLHDLTLQRTTNGTGLAHRLRWAELAQLDAGSAFDVRYAGEPMARLADVAEFCVRQSCFINLEIKPPKAGAFAAGEAVAQQALRLWRTAAAAPLLSSFSTDALRGAQKAAPKLPRALLLERLGPGWQEHCLELGCVAVVGDHRAWTQQQVTRAQASGLRVLSYTVNAPAEAQRLQALGTQGIISDCLFALPVDG